MFSKLKSSFQCSGCGSKQASTYNHFFKKKKEYLRVEEIVFITKSQIFIDYDVNKKIFNVSTLKNATMNDVSFLTNKSYVDMLKETKAGVVFVPEEFKEVVPSDTLVLVNDNPHYAYTLCLQNLYDIPSFNIKRGFSKRANISWSAKIGRNCEIQAGAYIGKNVVIGDNCKICVNAVIYDNCVIGDGTYIGSNATIAYAIIGKECVIHNGANIGQDGFGFVHDKMFNYKVPQIGKVIIGDYVEIGSCTCIDRGALDDTTIGTNTKIDNLNQIAHGVKIGAGCFIAGHCGIAGSTKIGNFVQCGGHTGMAGHIEIADGVQIAGHSGVAKSILEAGAKYGGSPAVPYMEWHRQHLTLEKMSKRK
jgi:UDP-3-O-[3-hydroxymyristoyl] glucosamine N-acyltransferase